MIEPKKEETEQDKTPKSNIKNKPGDGRSSQMNESNTMNRTDGIDMKNEPLQNNLSFYDKPLNLQGGQLNVLKMKEYHMRLNELINQLKNKKKED